MLPASSLVVPNSPAYLRSLPHLDDAFCRTFTSVFVQTEAVRLHAVVGGQGPVLLLISGWPQFWYAWRLVLPTLAARYTVVAVDPRGAGLSDKPAAGYDLATLATDLVQCMRVLGYERFAVLGHDVGMWVGYALAADYPVQVVRLAVAEATIPGLAPSPPLLGPKGLNNFLWHFAFNRADGINEQLVRGREDLYFGYQFRSKAATPDAIPAYAVAVYVAALQASPQALAASFAYYRDLDISIAQNVERKKTSLAIPVLAVAGAKACQEGVARDMRLVADDVTSLIIADCGHFVAEEAPQELLAAVQAFLEPYRVAHQVTATSGF